MEERQDAKLLGRKISDSVDLSGGSVRFSTHTGRKPMSKYIHSNSLRKSSPQALLGFLVEASIAWKVLPPDHGVVISERWRSTTGLQRNAAEGWNSEL